MAKKIRKRNAHFFVDGGEAEVGGKGKKAGPSGMDIAGAAIGGVSSMISGITDMVNAPGQVAAQKAAEVQQYQNQTSNFEGSSNQDLLSQSNFGMSSAGSFRDFMGSKGENAMGAINMGLQGASAGAAAGGLGMAIGAGAGLLGGIFGAAAKRRKAKKAYANAKMQSARANAAAIDNYNTAVESADTKNDLQALANYAAYGGPINMHYTGNMSPFGNRYDFGGDITTNGADWSNGYVTINNGGTHEANPYEGVQVGTDSQGVPNLVEEGEFIHNDYVFSNRMKVPKSVRSKYKLRNNKDMTYADAAKEISKESEERPNDPISKRGMDAMLGVLAESQEDERFKKAMRNPETRKQLMTQLAHQQSSPQAPQQEQVQPRKFATGGSENTVTPLAGNVNTGPESKPYNPWNWFEEYNSDPEKTYLQQYDDSFKKLPETVATKVAEISQKDPEHKNYTEYKEDRITPWLRYVPALGAAIGAAQNIFSKPDYSNADAIQNMAATMGQYTPVEAKPLGDYMTYNPFDRNYYINKLNGQAAATKRAIVNQSAGNRATAIAGLLSADYNAQGKLGDLARQAEEYNLGQRERVATFNRATNQYNSEMALKADMANQDILSRARNAQYTGLLQAMQLRDNIDARRAQTKSANLTNLFNSLGDIGKEAATRNMINTNPGFYYTVGSEGVISYKSNYDDLDDYSKKLVKRAAERNAKKQIKQNKKAANKKSNNTDTNG